MPEVLTEIHLHFFLEETIRCTRPLNYKLPKGVGGGGAGGWVLCSALQTLSPGRPCVVGAGEWKSCPCCRTW